MTERPASVALEVSAVCSLGCPGCPTRAPRPGRAGGFLGAADLAGFLSRHEGVSRLYLGGRGEIFQNPELPELLRLCQAHGVAVTMTHGANLNQVSDAAAEALVRSRVRTLRCAVDGATRETYRRYRRGGDLDTVLGAIRRINRLKARHGSPHPRLVLQFIPFAHNVHELDQAAMLARLLDMGFTIRHDCASGELDPSAAARVLDYSPYSSRDDYLRKEGRHYLRVHCLNLWLSPRFTWDGGVQGCTPNTSFGRFPGNLFQDGLDACWASEPMDYARSMLMGMRPPREDIPCVRCPAYRTMLERGGWVTEEEIRQGSQALEAEFT